MRLGQMIKRQRLALEMSQVRLGDLLEVSQQRIGQWEKGEGLPSGKDRGLLERLAMFLDEPYDTVLTRVIEEHDERRMDLVSSEKLDDILVLVTDMTARLSAVERELGLAPAASSEPATVSTIPGYLNRSPRRDAERMARESRELERVAVAS